MTSLYFNGRQKLKNQIKNISNIEIGIKGSKLNNLHKTKPKAIGSLVNKKCVIRNIQSNGEHTLTK